MVMEELAKRVVACKAWRWMPGMQAHHPWARRRVLAANQGCLALYYDHRKTDPSLCDASELGTPNLEDPATVGCLEALVREAWQNDIGVSRDGGSWTITAEGGAWCGHGQEEYVEALVCALEAAP